MDQKFVRLLVLGAFVFAAFAAGFLSGATYQAARPFIKRPGSMSSGE
jgi:hypothetical protein